jgi:hypothetical protein
MELVKSEMDWTINSFAHKERMWKEMAEAGEKEGHRAYAWKQCWMWGGWAKTAAATFKSLKGTE